MDGTPIPVMIVDDHLVVRQGLRSLLAEYADVVVVGEADGGPSTLELIAQARPAVILLDIRLIQQSGLELARQLRRRQPDARIIILTSHEEESYLLEAAQAGLHGYLLKTTSAEVLADSIRAVHHGERRLSPALAGKAFAQLEAVIESHVRADSGLSDQELSLLRLLAEGAGMPEMSQSLFLSERTIKRKLQDVMGKLGANSRAQAVAEAFRRGLLLFVLSATSLWEGLDGLLLQ